MLTLCFCLLLWGTPAQDLVGAWELQKEDGVETIRTESLYLYADGNLMLDGDVLHKGSYKLDGDNFETSLYLAGEETKYARKFLLEGDTLRLSVEKGFSYYKKLDKPLPKWEGAGYVAMEIGFFKFSAPASWQIRKEPPAENGSQHLSLLDTRGNSALTLQRIPGRGVEVDLRAALKGVIGSMLEGLGIERTVINENEGVYFDRVGVRLEATKKFDDDRVVAVQTFGQKLDNDKYLVAMFSYEEGKGGDLARIMDSLITPDDPNAEVAKAAFAKKLEAEAKAKAEAKKHDGHDDHSGHGH